MNHLPARLTLVSTWLLLGFLCYRTVAVPAPNATPVDPSGAYLSHCYGRPAYRVLVVNENGVYRTAWGTLGDNAVTHYRGTLKRDGDDWIETYDSGPTVRSSAPWRWQQVGADPLDFDGDHSWDLRGQKPDL